MASLPGYLSPEDYLAIERKADIKSEYVNGVMYLMSGASFAHNIIVGNLIGELHARFKETDCGAYPSDLKVRLPDSSSFFYPGVSVLCCEPQFADREKDVVLNPIAVLEVLSNSTEAFDRGKKFQYYQQIESLMEYVLIAQDTMVVESFQRQPGKWLHTKAWGPDASLTLTSVDCQIPLRDIYRKAF